MQPVQNVILNAYCFSLFLQPVQMVAIAQLVRASDCGSEGRGFEPHWLPEARTWSGLFFSPYGFYGGSSGNIRNIE